MSSYFTVYIPPQSSQSNICLLKKPPWHCWFPVSFWSAMDLESSSEALTPGRLLIVFQLWQCFFPNNFFLTILNFTLFSVLFLNCFFVDTTTFTFSLFSSTLAVTFSFVLSTWFQVLGDRNNSQNWIQVHSENHLFHLLFHQASDLIVEGYQVDLSMNPC